MFARFKIPISLGELLKRTLKETLADDVLNLAAQQAYYFFFALFPMLLAILAFASFFPVGNLTDELWRMLGGAMPQGVWEMIKTQLDKIQEQNAGGLLTFAFLVTLWSSSGAIVSLCSTLNAAYDITEGRPWWKVRLTAIGLTIGLSLFILTSMVLVLGGPWLADRVADIAGLGPAFAITWKILQWPLVFVLIASAVAILYYFAPDAEQHFVWITPGSVLATLLWVVISVVLQLFFQNFGSYTETYGVIGGVMMLMLWFYCTGIAILVGAELNAEIEHASPYGKDVGEKIPGEKKKIGALAEHAYEEKRRKSEVQPRAFPEGVNCDLEHGPAANQHHGGLRPSEAIIGAALLLPAALKAAKTVKDTLSGTRRDAAANDEANAA
jgi:membrane protein